MKKKSQPPFGAAAKTAPEVLEVVEGHVGISSESLKKPKKEKPAPEPEPVVEEAAPVVESPAAEEPVAVPAAEPETPQSEEL